MPHGSPAPRPDPLPIVPRQSLQFLDDQRLANAITTLAANIHAASFRLLELIAEFDTRRGWASDGARSCAHWLNWGCGIGLHAAREKVRVAHALVSLPKLGEAFSRGEVSYSKVRAITRVATPENEDYLLMIAQHGTAGHVERLVTAYRRALGAADRERTRRQYADRQLHWRVDDDGMLEITCRLPPEAGAAVIKAIEAAVDDLDADTVDSVEATDTDTDTDTGTDTGTGTGTDAETANGPAQPGDVPAGTPGNNPITPRRPSVPSAPGKLHSTATNANALSEEAATIGQRRADALGLLASAYIEHGPPARSAGDRYQVVLHVDAEVLANPDQPGRCEAEGGPAAALPAVAAQRLSCDCSVTTVVDGAGGGGGRSSPLDVGRRTRIIPPAIRRALNARDRGCRFPGCTATRFVHAHHVTHWAAGGRTSLDNLVTLCSFHHHLVHEGGYGVEVAAAQPSDGFAGAGAAARSSDSEPDREPEFIFTRPNGSRLPDCLVLQAQDPIEAANRRIGLAILPDTCRPRWDGKPMDYDLGVLSLYQCDHPPLPRYPDSAA